MTRRHKGYRHRNLLGHAFHTLTARILGDFRRSVIHERAASSAPTLVRHRNGSESHMTLP